MNLSPKGERIREHLIASGELHADEIDTLFKTEEDLLAYYEASKSAAAISLNPATDPDPEPVDDFRLSKAEEASVLETERLRKRELERAKFEKAKEETQSEAPVSFDDVLKSLEDGYSADDSNVPNN